MDIVPVQVGLDYHEETIRVCVMNEDGDELVNRNAANDPHAVRDLVRRAGGEVRGVAIEACCGSDSRRFARRCGRRFDWGGDTHPGVWC